MNTNFRRKDMKNRPIKSMSHITRQRTLLAVFAISILLSGLSISALAQTPELSLADIIVALRSKKATLPEKNKILTDAVQSRGTTFTLTPEIEKELEGTGADLTLIDSIKRRSQIAKTTPINSTPGETKPKTDASPAVASPSEDFSFYEKRGDASFAKGDVEAAMMDYTKAIELNDADVSALSSRAALYFGKNSFTLAIADYTKVIDLAPKNPAAYAHRGEAYEKKGNNDLALADYKKALEIDASNELAKSSVARLEPPKPKVVPTPEPTTAVAAAPMVENPVVLPEYIYLGNLTESMATNVVKPIYPQSALHSNIAAKVVVEIEIEKDGSVKSAKAVSGNPYFNSNCEDAAKRWKFKPTKVADQAVKAKGYITFNFVPAR